ncbi:uncharacterized protein VNE69_12138 [Vairimorpha necatrix]|uniref:Uncharacterized protein n=1 Tax=Vairimorpha necatrix TaxID=6039 RepID=A0AAX4JHQ2_9MICR
MVNSELIEYINTSVCEYVKLYPPNRLTDIARILQSSQIVCKNESLKLRVKSTWKKNITKKINICDEKITLTEKLLEENKI